MDELELVMYVGTSDEWTGIDFCFEKKLHSCSSGIRTADGAKERNFNGPGTTDTDVSLREATRRDEI
jgi:hypothetical protein